MLVLSAKPGERVLIDGGRIVVTVVRVQGDQVRLGFDAPRSVQIVRENAKKQDSRNCGPQGCRPDVSV